MYLDKSKGAATAWGRRVWGVAFCCLFFAGVVWPQYRLDYFTTDNGLPQNSVFAIAQTRDGYLWLATSDGLARYDGARFTVFNRGNTPGILSNRFGSLYEAPDGALWASTEDSGIVRYQGGVFTSYTTAQGLPDNGVFRIYGDHDGNILAKTNKGIFFWRDGHFAPFSDNLPAEQRRAYLAPSGTLWLVEKGRLRQIKDGQESVYPFNPCPSDWLAVPLLEDSQGRLWLTTDCNLTSFAEGRFTTPAPLLNSLLPIGSGVQNAYEDRQGGLWFGSNLGLFYRNPQDGSFSLPVPELTGVAAVCKDREGTLWVGTNAAGLIHLTRRFITSLSTAQGLPDKNVYPLYQDRAGQVWLGISGGLAKFADGKFTDYPIATHLSANSNRRLVYPAKRRNSLFYITALLEDRDGVLWVGAWDWLLSFHDNRVTDRTPLLKQGTYPETWDIHQDRNGALWFATSEGLYQLREGQITSYSQTDGLPADDVRVIHEARNGTFWFGTYQGLAHLQNGKFSILTEKDGLAGNRLRAIHEEADGTFWFGTYDSGLSRYKDGKFTNYNTANGLFNNGVFAIMEDRHGYFWMSSNNGIHRVAKQQLSDFADGKIASITSNGYGKQDGMLNAECNGGRQPAALQMPDGKLWFPTQDGVAVVDPDNVPSNPLPPPVLLENASIDYKNAPLADGVRVAPGQNNLEINYTALTFIHPEQVRFKYRLEGQDKVWVDAGTRRTAYFSYLPPGNYTFRVIAANADGVWNETGAALKISVRPPFYRTWWFILLSLLTLAGLLYAGYRNRIWQLLQAHSAREALSRQLLEAQESFSQQLIISQETERQRIAAELHDGLGQNLLIIKNRALLGGLKDSGETSQQFAEISETASRSIEEVRQIAYNLRPYHLDRLGLTKALNIMVEQMGETSGIDFTADIAPLDKLFTPEQEINIYRVVQECLNNIAKHSGAETACVEIVHAEDTVEILVSDDGNGFTPENIAAKRFKPGGFGLIGLTERVRMLHGTKFIDSTPGRGTKISIKLAAILPTDIV